MKLKRFLVVAAAGGLALPAYWHPTSASITQCSDKIDNDGDGGIDNDGGDPPNQGPKDLDCTSYEDPSEFGPGGPGPAPTPTNNTSNSSSTATNTNSNTSTNTNNNSSTSGSTSSSNGSSGSSSTACLLLCDSELLSNVLSGLPALGV